MVAPLVAAMSPALPPSEKSLISESTPSQFSFPNEFPYEFDSSFFSSPGDSTETEDESSDDEDDFLAGLTRRLALSTQRLSSPSLVTVKDEVKQPHVTEDSSESTLSALGSPNGPFSQVPSPPTSLSNEEDSFKVISAAAGEVAKMKMANFDTKPKSRLNPNPNFLTSVPYPNAAFCGYYVLQPRRSSHYHQSLIRYRSALQPVMFVSPYPVRGALSAVKQPSSGTGVFLPRNYPNSSVSRKKSGGGGVRVPAKVVNQQKPKMEELSKGRSKVDNVGGGKKERPLPQLQEWMH